MDSEVLKAIINTNHSIIIGLDYMNICRIFSQGAEKITGYAKDEILGKKWNEIFLASEDQEKLDIIWKAAWDKDYDKISTTIEENASSLQTWEVISGKEVYNMIGPLQIRNGEIKTIFWQNTKIHESDDIKQHLLVSIGIDITEQKRYEKLIVEQNTEYEALNEELRLTNEDLYEAVGRAEESEKALQNHQMQLENIIKARTSELEEKNKELERLNKLFVGREFRIKELKERVKELETYLK